MKMNETVYFNQEKNSFYRINKLSGKSIRSYRNGDPLRKFQPSVTGFDYNIRKVSHLKLQSNEKQQKPSSLIDKVLKHKVKRSQKKNDQSSRKRLLPKFNKTIDYSLPNKDSANKSKQLSIEDSLKTPRKYSSAFNSYNETAVTTKKNSIFLSTITYPSICENSSISNSRVSKIEKEQNIFFQTMKKFSQLSTERKLQNNSPDKQINGNSPLKEPFQTLGTTMKDFKEKFVSKYVKQHDSIQKQIKINERIPQQYSPKQQKKQGGKILLSMQNIQRIQFIQNMSTNKMRKAFKDRKIERKI